MWFEVNIRDQSLSISPESKWWLLQLYASEIRSLSLLYSCTFAWFFYCQDYIPPKNKNTRKWEHINYFSTKDSKIKEIDYSLNFILGSNVFMAVCKDRWDGVLVRMFPGTILLSFSVFPFLQRSEDVVKHRTLPIVSAGSVAGLLSSPSFSSCMPLIHRATQSSRFCFLIWYLTWGVSKMPVNYATFFNGLLDMQCDRALG